MAASMEDAAGLLNDVFGYKEFRTSQHEVIETLLVKNKSACCVLPTGGGKSLTFQVPALLLDGLTLVVSPLIALMRDQVSVLRDKGIPAAAWDSSIDAAEVGIIRKGLKDGSLKILYVAPEKLNNENFVQQITACKIALLAVDESHCISSWGHSFRPDYLKVARFAKEVNAERVLCLTATATQHVVDDICQQFDIEPEACFVTGVYRENLALTTVQAANDDAKIKHLVAFLQALKAPAIVYVTTQAQAEDVAKELAGKLTKHPVKHYHAGMTAEARRECQDCYMSASVGTVVATIAFGMGIDKANIRAVIHFHFPKTPEGYSQEVGRAGRDGLPSTCVLFCCAEDLPLLEGFARGDTPSLPAVKAWIKEVSKLPKEDGDENVVHANLYAQAKDCDIKNGVLGLLYAYLELDYGYLRNITPFYQNYEMHPKVKDISAMTSGNSEAAIALQRNWKTSGSMSSATGGKFTVDIVTVAKASGVKQTLLSSQISKWEWEGLITSKPSQVRNRWRLLKPFPQSAEEQAILVTTLHERMVQKETSDIERMNNLAAMATKPACLAQSLCLYFDGDGIPGGKCGKCTFCSTGSPSSFGGTKAVAPITDAQVDKILQACTVRSDSSVLVKLAFGISTPRLTQLGLGRDSTFGSMSGCSYDELKTRFEAECAKVDYKDVASGGKRPADSASGPPAKKTNTGRGGAAKSTTRGRGRGR